MTFAKGVREIMTISEFHELVSGIIDHFMLEWRVAKRIPVRPTGSMTLRKQYLDRGLEGEQSYYIADEAKVRGRVTIDLEEMPPPDLAVEVEHTNSALGKMPIYAQLGVPEVWRFQNETLTVHHLHKGIYTEAKDSEVFPDFPIDRLHDALSRRHETDQTTLVGEFRHSFTTANRQNSQRDNKTCPMVVN